MDLAASNVFLFFFINFTVLYFLPVPAINRKQLTMDSKPIRDSREASVRPFVILCAAIAALTTFNSGVNTVSATYIHCT